ncbi:MAG: 30S ribosomal protein S2 [Chlamydiota bacterium]
MSSQQSEKQGVTIQQLLESGAHFGHQKKRWNPKMRRFILEERNGIYIINLAKTMQQIRDANQVVIDVVAKHKSILFVGTKKQAKAAIEQFAQEAEEFYVSERWLGGMLTNLTTIRKSVKKLERIEKIISAGSEGLKKKEIARLQKEQQKLERNLAGIRAMRKPPGLVVVVDPNKEHIAVAEAKKLGIPVMAIVDTNCDPDPIDYVIACNDDALKSIKVVLHSLMRAIVSKKAEMQTATKKVEKKPTTLEEETGKEENHG